MRAPCPQPSPEGSSTTRFLRSRLRRGLTPIEQLLHHRSGKRTSSTQTTASCGTCVPSPSIACRTPPPPRPSLLDSSALAIQLTRPRHGLNGPACIFDSDPSRLCSLGRRYVISYAWGCAGNDAESCPASCSAPICAASQIKVAIFAIEASALAAAAVAAQAALVASELLVRSGEGEGVSATRA